MAKMANLLENLPTELIEMIFKYLSGSDIYFSFGSLNSRFQKIVGNYRYFLLDFRLISKFIFDSIIKSIQPSNICALTLSNADETIGQIEFFLSYWKLSDFVNLRSLHLHDVERNILLRVSRDMMQLSKLVSLCIDGSEIYHDFYLEDLWQLRHLQYLYIPNCYYSLEQIHRLLTVGKLTHVEINCDWADMPNVFNSAAFLRSVTLHLYSSVSFKFVLNAFFSF